MKIKNSLLAYLSFLIFCFGVACLYLSSISETQPVSELLAVTGPMPLLYLFTTMGWVPHYFVFTLVSILVTAVLWFFAFNWIGIKRYLASLAVPLFWVLSGLFSLGISYYG